MHRIFFLITFIFYTFNAFASYDQALTLFNNKKYQESLKILAEQLISADDFKPNSPNYKIRYLAAHNHWKLGNDQSAIAHFRKCMAIDKGKIDPYIDLAILLTEHHKLSAASTVVEDGLRIKELPVFYWILGRIAYMRNDNWKAKELFEKANVMDPEFYVSINDLGSVLMRLKKYGEANAAFSVALAIDPDSPEINNNMALSLLMMGKTNDAVFYIKKATELAPDNQKIKKLSLRINEKNR